MGAELAQREGLILRAMGDSLALCPPLIITKPEINEVFDLRLERALEHIHGEVKQRADCCKRPRRPIGPQPDDLSVGGSRLPRAS